jgi:hypothetical protein
MFNYLPRARPIPRRPSPLWLVLLVLAALVAGLILLTETQDKAMREAETQDTGAVDITGLEETIFDWSQDACAPDDIPDIPARAFRDAQGRVQLIASHYTNRRMSGPDLDHLLRDCGVVMPSSYNPDPAMFDDREWIHSPYTLDGTTVFALVHDEYQGHTHPGRCPSGEYFACWYNAVTLAVSTDGGASFEHATPPPNNLVAGIPYPYVPDSGPAGIFQPSNIVHNADDDHYYALLRVQQHQAQPQGTCVMRTTDLADPGSWRAWGGSGFDVRFIDPYLEPDDRPQDHICRPVSHDEIQLMVESLTFNTYLDRFLLVGTAVEQDREGDTVSGIYYSTSDDLIHWTPREMIAEVENRETYRCGDPDPVAYPSVLDPDSSSRNFETTGKRAYLYFTRFNYESCKETFDRDLVRAPIEFSK